VHECRIRKSHCQVNRQDLCHRRAPSGEPGREPPGQPGLPAPETWETAQPSVRRPAGVPRAADASRGRERSGKGVCRTGETREALYRPEEDLPSPGFLCRVLCNPTCGSTTRLQAPFLHYGIVFAISGVKIRLLLGSLSMEVSRVSGMFADRHIVSLGDPWRHDGCRGRLRERVRRSTRHGKTEHVPSPAAVAGTPAGHGVAGGITGH
jgi:hypothetical protein